MARVSLSLYNHVSGNHIREEVIERPELIDAIVAAVIRGQDSGFDFLVYEAPGDIRKLHWAFRGTKYSESVIRQHLAIKLAEDISHT